MMYEKIGAMLCFIAKSFLLDSAQKFVKAKEEKLRAENIKLSAECQNLKYQLRAVETTLGSKEKKLLSI